MELTGFIPLIRRWWWLLVLATVLAGGTAYAIASRLAPTYEAAVSLLTGPLNTDYTTLRASGDLARTYAQLATSGPVLRATSRRLRLGLSPEDMRETVRATSNDVTRIVTISASDADAERAATIANELARQLRRLAAGTRTGQLVEVEELFAQPEIRNLSDDAQQQARIAAERVLSRQPLEGRLQVVDPATAPEEPTAPRVSLLTALAALAGLLAAGTVVLVREFSTNAIDDADGLAQLAGAPTLASVDSVPRFSARRPRQLVAESMPASQAAEAYRLLAARIGFGDEQASVRSVLVVGAQDGDGAGALAAELAGVLAESGSGITLIDANTVEREITALLGLGDRPGYSELQSSNGTLDEYCIRRSPEFCILPSGSSRGAGLGEIESAQLVLERLLQRGDLVVINAPAVGRSLGTLVWARLADATVLVVRQGKSRRENVAAAIDTLREVRANLAGTVLGRSRLVRPRS